MRRSFFVGTSAALIAWNFLATLAAQAAPPPTPTQGRISETETAGGKQTSRIENKDAFIPNRFWVGPGPNRAIKMTDNVFNFHPVESQLVNHAYNIATTQLSIPQLTVNYTETEKHATRGTISHDMTISAVDGDPKKGYKISDNVTLEILPGKNNEQKVSITTNFRDPWSFGDNSPDANFEFTPAADGLYQSLSIAHGTAFPEVFSPNGIDFGALPDDTSMEFVARVIPSINNDAESFWGSMSSGGIDLYDLKLTSDVNHNVTAVLTLGQSNGNFTIDYKDQSGTPFDPWGNPQSVIDMQNYIAGQFVAGVLPTDLNDIFSVGFTPTGATSMFTTGFQQVASVSAVEVPEPASCALLGLGAMLLFAGITRRKTPKY